MKTITASLDLASIDAALEEVNNYINSFTAKYEEFLERLAKYGSEVAGLLFGNDTAMSYEKVSDGVYTITATGERVCFIEFGAGVFSDSSHPYASEVPIKVYPGSWSEDHAQTYQEWVKKGRKGWYRYNRYPRYAMLTAYNKMVDYVPELAREVFGA